MVARGARGLFSDREFEVSSEHGETVWATKLKGGDFVNVVLDDGELYAAARGEISCLDPATGNIRWTNPLKGYGLGLASIASPGGSQAVLLRSKRREEEQQAAAT